MRRWARDLALGLRLAVTGGGTRLRSGLTAVGVAFGVALLLVAAGTPHIRHARDERSAARQWVRVAHGESLRLADTSTTFRSTGIQGLTVQPLRAGAPVPPGIPRLPGPGEMYVSPKVMALLDGPDGALLRARLDARVVGIIGKAGLLSPSEASYVRGSVSLPSPARDARVFEASGFGRPAGHEPLGPLFTLLVVVMIVALLVPVGVFVATAVRFGGEERDRRLAALRLAGADRATTARVAAGETLLGALGGLVVGGGLFFALRPVLQHVRVAGIAVYGSDIVPSVGLTLVVVVLVPAAAVIATLAALRGVAIEPLGVTRKVRPPRRRFLWRLLPTVAGLAVLAPFFGDAGKLTGDAGRNQATVGVLLMLVGLTVLLPWLVEAVVARAPDGSLPWQLAVRRLQLDGGTTGRVVGGIAVAVAGAIALQTVFAAAADQTERSTGIDTSRVNVMVDASPHVSPVALQRELLRTPGVRTAFVRLDTSGGVPQTHAMVLATREHDGIDRVRTLVAQRDPLASVIRLDDSIEPPQLSALRRILFAGAALVLAMIGASMLVAAIEQLRERRQVLAVLSAFGTRRRTLALSVLWQTAIPVTLGLTLALGTGLLLGTVLLKIIDAPIHIDWLATTALLASGALVVALVTLLSLPALVRLTRPEALRAE
ncbi:FtsX-like permease family protein [Conexibacter woesei]|uniref:FtsX-like permease family protein n=1 Tax=Conexibacter woesei TaxID=191495 RepID=UPI0003F57262|nr:FtsX-like permease family protein [Conexibacter woesei]